jgi:hypothetical protein
VQDSKAFTKCDDDLNRCLQELMKIKDEITGDLVGESRSLIERTHNIFAIDEAYLAREQNSSLKRLSWIIFILLPLLFVASLHGMNIDLLEDNPAWVTYFHIAISLFIVILSTVYILKVLDSQSIKKRIGQSSMRLFDWMQERRPPMSAVFNYFWKHTFTTSYNAETADQELGTISTEVSLFTRLISAARDGWAIILKDNLFISDMHPEQTLDLMVAAAQAGHVNVLKVFVDYQSTTTSLANASNCYSYFYPVLLKEAVEHQRPALVSFLCNPKVVQPDMLLYSKESVLEALDRCSNDVGYDLAHLPWHLSVVLSEAPDAIQSLSESSRESDSFGRLRGSNLTGIHYAELMHDWEMVQLLIDLGADVNVSFSLPTGQRTLHNPGRFSETGRYDEPDIAALRTLNIESTYEEWSSA